VILCPFVISITAIMGIYSSIKVVILIILLIPLSLTTKCYASTYSDALEEIGGGTLTGNYFTCKRNL